MKGSILAALAAASLCGCIMPTKQPQPQQVREAPAERVFLKGTDNGQTGEAVVVRDVGFVGSGCFLGVMVDGTMAAHLDPGEKVVLPLAPGRHVLTATPVQGRGLCGALQTDKSNAAHRRSVEIYVEAGQSRSYRLLTPVEDYPYIEPAI